MLKAELNEVGQERVWNLPNPGAPKGNKNAAKVKEEKEGNECSNRTFVLKRGTIKS